MQECQGEMLLQTLTHVFITHQNLSFIPPSWHINLARHNIKAHTCQLFTIAQACSVLLLPIAWEMLILQLFYGGFWWDGLWMLTGLPSMTAPFKSSVVKLSLQTGKQGTVCVFFKEKKKTPTAVGVCPWFSGPCSCPWHHRGGWHSSRLFPSQMPRALGCCSSWPPARLSPLPPQPPHLRGCTTGRRLPLSSAGSHLFPTWASMVVASLPGNKPGLAEGPKGLRIPNPAELYRFPVLMKLLAGFLGSRQTLVFAPWEAGTPPWPWSLPPSPAQKGGKAFSVSLYTQGKQCKKAVWKLLLEFMDVAKRDWNYACKCG